MTDDKEPCRRMRLKDTHPTVQKYNKLHDFAEELGIAIHFYGHRTIIHDEDFPHAIDMEDIEGDSHHVDHFPYCMEAKFTFDNPEYEKLMEGQAKEREAKHKAEEDARKTKAEAQRKAEEARKKAAEEVKERALLAKLKRKYES